ncbi:MAG: 6-phosphogluconolactonase [Actinobacteria bacterium]|nr:MAG: 6-phosphogluconolactonase [Actinomycetota bacterium]
MTETLVLEDPAGECAGRLAAAAAAGSHIALTGGSTPRVAYERLAGMDVDWSGTTLWFGDDRCVPPDDELSNYRMAKEALLDRLPSEDEGGPAVKRILGERGPHAGADDYERQLRATLGEELPRLDVVLLGLGPDAHVASLFPGQPTLEVQDRLAVGVEEAGMEPYVPRVSLTLPSGAVGRAFGDEPDPGAPGSRVRPHSGELTVLLDAGAARGLTGASE